MHYPLSVLGPAAVASADPAWMSPGAATTILEMLPRLPDIASTVGFEIRLTGDDRCVDFGVSLQRSPLVLAAWGGFRDGAGGHGIDLPAWGGFEVFLDAWCAEDSALDPWIPFIFLEVDADGGTFTPCVFTSFDWPLAAHDDAEERVRSWRVAESALDLLLQDRLPVEVRARVREAFEILPPAGRVVHAGAMLGRRAEQVRLSIAVPKRFWADYLDHFGMETTRYREALELVDPLVDNVHFECDFAETPGTRIGIVVEGQALTNERLGRAGGLIQDVRDPLWHLLSWQRRSLSTSGLSCSISHLKLDVTPESTRIKAYVSIAPRANSLKA